MPLTVNIKDNFNLLEVTNVIRSALAFDEKIARHKIKKYSSTCRNFEIKYGMSSDIFMEKFNSGQLDDRDDFFDWYAVKKGLDIWSKKIDILSGISL